MDRHDDFAADGRKEGQEPDASYRSVFEATSDAMCIIDQQGFIVEANAAACRMHGYTRDEFVGLHLSALTHPHDHPTIPQGMREVEEGGAGHRYVLGVRKDGSTFYEETRGTTVTYRGTPHFLGVARDITERVQAYELLEQRVEERTRELATLLEVSSRVASTLELRPLLSLILDQLQTIIDYSGAAIHVLDGDWLEMLEHRLPVGTALGAPRHPASSSQFWQTALRHGESVVLDDIGDTSPNAAVYRAILGGNLEAVLPHVCSYSTVPLMVRDRVIGALTLTHRTRAYFTPPRQKLLLALASQAAVAIENARLYERVREMAALEERQRLSRELHDSVSQALYSIALGARTARMLLDRDPARAAEPLDFVLTQAGAGLAEMRALIFALRPEALVEEGLVAALRRQADLMQAHHPIAVEVTPDAEPTAPLAVKEALYRVALEALHNTVKHAQASTVELTLTDTGEALLLRIRDDGRGFDPTAAYPGHLGLQSMRERITRLGGTLQIESTPRAGTCVSAAVPTRPPAGTTVETR